MSRITSLFRSAGQHILSILGRPSPQATDYDSASKEAKCILFEALDAARLGASYSDASRMLRHAINKIRALRRSFRFHLRGSEWARAEAVLLVAEGFLYSELAFLTVDHLRTPAGFLSALYSQGIMGIESDSLACVFSDCQRMCEEGISAFQEALSLLDSASLEEIVEAEFGLLSWINAHACLCSEAALMASSAGDRDRAISLVREACRLQPYNAQFQLNLAAQLLFAEGESDGRNPQRRREILNCLREAASLAAHGSFKEMIAAFKQLGTLSQEEEKTLCKLEESLRCTRSRFAGEFELYRRVLAKFPGPEIRCVLCDAAIVPLSELGSFQWIPDDCTNVMALRLRYAISEEASIDRPEERRRLRTLAGLAVCCWLGLVGERAGITLSRSAERPNPLVSGPEWDAGPVRGLTVVYAHVILRAEINPAVIEIWIAQTIWFAKPDSFQRQSGYVRLLTGLYDAFRARCGVLVVGAENPFPNL